MKVKAGTHCYGNYDIQHFVGIARGLLFLNALLWRNSAVLRIFKVAWEDADRRTGKNGEQPCRGEKSF